VTYLTVPGADFSKVLNGVCRAEGDELCEKVKKANLDTIRDAANECGPTYACYKYLSTCTEEGGEPECDGALSGSKNGPDCGICQAIIENAREAYKYSGDPRDIALAVNNSCSQATSGKIKVCNRLKQTPVSTIADYLLHYTSNEMVCAKFSFC